MSNEFLSTYLIIYKECIPNPTALWSSAAASRVQWWACRSSVPIARPIFCQWRIWRSRMSVSMILSMVAVWWHRRRIWHLENKGSNGHVLVVLKWLQDFHHFVHRRSLLWAVAQTLVRQCCRFSRSGLRVLSFQSHVHDPRKLSVVHQHRTGILDQILFTVRSSLVERSSSSQQLQKYYSETVHITHCRQMTWQKKQLNVSKLPTKLLKTSMLSITTISIYTLWYLITVCSNFDRSNLPVITYSGAA